MHTATAALLGMPLNSVASAIDEIETAPVENKMKPVLRYARKLTQKASSVTQSDADAIFVAGWDETALYHTVAVTALFNFMNRLVEGIGIELDLNHVKPASELLATSGYLSIIEMLKL